MSEQAVWTLAVGLTAAVPGLIAFWLIRRRGPSDDAKAARADAEQLRAEARALLQQVGVQTQIQEQMQEQIRAQQQTIRFLTKRVDELEAARAREYVETESLRQENEGLRQEIAELRRGVAALSRQMEDAKLTPAWKPPQDGHRAEKARPSAGPDPVALRNKLIDQFSLDEIGDLAFELGVNADEISGTTAKAKARA